LDVEVNPQQTVLNLVKSMFCKECEVVHILNNQIECRMQSCDCSQQIPMETIFDLYSNLYNFAITNYKIFYSLSLIKENKDIIHNENNRIENIWQAHYDESPYYDYRSRKLRGQTTQLILEDLRASSNHKILLFRWMIWLLTLDRSLHDLRMNLSLRNLMFHDTYRGRLLVSVGSMLTQYIQQNFEQNQRSFPPDSNYTHLRHIIRNFHLVQRSRLYNIQHHQLGYMKEQDPSDVGQLRIGFITGNMTAEDYIWDVLEGEQEHSFLFEGIVKARYTKQYRRAYQAVLNQKPNLIMLSELISPLEMQNELIASMHKDHQRDPDAISDSDILLTGSFHENFEGQDYNYAQIAVNGTKAADIHKTNVFKVNPSSKLKGNLAKFTTIPGVERISLNRNTINLLETELGRIAVFICIDFITDDIHDLLLKYHVDVILVMAYTQNPAGGKFEREVHRLGERIHATVIICNNAGSRGEQARIVTYFPGLKLPYVSSRYVKVLSIHEMFTKALKATLEDELLRKQALLSKQGK
jgi:predicted amidohydrolase